MRNNQPSMTTLFRRLLAAAILVLRFIPKLGDEQVTPNNQAALTPIIERKKATRNTIRRQTRPRRRAAGDLTAKSQPERGQTL